MTDMTAGSTAATPIDAFSAAPMPTIRKVLEIVGWLAVATLIFTGLSALFGRAAFMSEALANPEMEMNIFDIRYYTNALATFLHLGPGLLIMVLGPLQFIPRIRKNYINFHRWSGRVYILCGAIGAFSGIAIGVFDPFGGLSGQGFNEAMATAFFASYILYSLYMAYYRIRQKQFGSHREWMIRSFALMLAIATERLMLLAFQATTNIDFVELFGATFWMAGFTNIVAAEIWINLTRTPGNGARHWKDLDAKNTA